MTKLRGQRQQGYDKKKAERGKTRSKKKNWQQQKIKRKGKRDRGEAKARS
jgi:hypothetical protein